MIAGVPVQVRGVRPEGQLSAMVSVRASTQIKVLPRGFERLEDGRYVLRSPDFQFYGEPPAFMTRPTN
jgi:hypothetical protein